MSNEAIIYKHRQTGFVIILICAVILFFSYYIYLYKTNHSVIELSILILINFFIFILFHSQTVEITDDFIIISMGVGLIRKKIPLDKINESKIVKNRWYYGWGIRTIPGGFMFNVSGFDAVELALNNRNNFRIGTDEPEKLHGKIQKIIKR